MTASATKVRRDEAVAGVPDPAGVAADLVGGARAEVAGPAGGPARGRFARVRRAWAATRELGDAGMATAEYAIATIAAAGFAGLLILVLRSDEVRGLLAGLVRTALTL